MVISLGSRWARKVSFFRDLIIGIISVAGPAENNEISVPTPKGVSSSVSR